VSIVYGTLYTLFSGFPIIFQEHRHFSPGEGVLASLGVGLGILGGLVSQPIQNRFYWRMMDKSEKWKSPVRSVSHPIFHDFRIAQLIPPSRLPFAMVGAILNPLGLWWFAWYVDSEISRDFSSNRRTSASQDDETINPLDRSYSSWYSVRHGSSSNFTGFDHVFDGHLHHLCRQRPRSLYSRTSLNPYLSVDTPVYGLWEVMGYEGSILV